MSTPITFIGRIGDEPVAAMVSDTAYMNAQIRPEQYDELMRKLDLILKQQSLIMGQIGLQTDGTPAHNAE